MAKRFFPPVSIPACFRLVFSALFCVTALCGCGGGNIQENAKNVYTPKENIPAGNNNKPVSGKQDGLSPETAGQIRWDYASLIESRVNGVWIIAYYGTYNNCVVVSMHNGQMGGTGAAGDAIIGETLFNSGHGITVWKEGQFYALHDAYNQGLLTNEDLRNIAYFHHQGRELNLENHAGLRIQTRSDIEIAYRFNYIAPYFPEAIWSDVWIEKYYGSYRYYYYGSSIFNDHVAVMMTTSYDEYADAPWEETVADTVFRYDDGNRILLWVAPDERGLGMHGHFYELQDAYNLGLLTEDDVRSIAYYHETGTALSYK